MEKITFILWVILWPLSCTIDAYYTAKRKEITGEPPTPKAVALIATVINLILWIGVARMLNK